MKIISFIQDVFTSAAPKDYYCVLISVIILCPRNYLSLSWHIIHTACFDGDVHFVRVSHHILPRKLWNFKPLFCVFSVMYTGEHTSNTSKFSRCLNGLVKANDNREIRKCSICHISYTVITFSKSHGSGSTAISKLEKTYHETNYKLSLRKISFVLVFFWKRLSWSGTWVLLKACPCQRISLPAAAMSCVGTKSSMKHHRMYPSPRWLNGWAMESVCELTRKLYRCREWTHRSRFPICVTQSPNLGDFSDGWSRPTNRHCTLIAWMKWRCVLHRKF